MGTEGHPQAQVTRGGVATDELSQATLEARKAPGLHFIGEAVDVTGLLVGSTLQWAWASGLFLRAPRLPELGYILDDERKNPLIVNLRPEMGKQ